MDWRLIFGVGVGIGVAIGVAIGIGIRNPDISIDLRI
jgi:hypothetical protein